MVDRDAAASDAPQQAPQRDGKRRRAPEAHRAAILSAARSAFAERGYSRTTIREVAARAGVTHGLVMRHFSSKEKLFVAAVPGSRDLADHLAGGTTGLAERVARAYVRRMESADQAGPFLALIRSAASDEISARRLLAAMRQQTLDAYRGILTAPDLPQRVDLAGAHLIGVTFSRYVLKDGSLASMSPEDLVRYLSASLHAILLGQDADAVRVNE